MIANLTPAYLLYWQVRIQMYSKSKNISMGAGTVFPIYDTGIEGTACAFFSLSTEVQRLSIVCSTSEVGYLYPLWNIQNLGAVPP